jgi:hypothetical protein
LLRRHKSIEKLMHGRLVAENRNTRKTGGGKEKIRIKA